MPAARHKLVAECIDGLYNATLQSSRSPSDGNPRRELQYACLCYQTTRPHNPLMIPGPVPPNLPLLVVDEMQTLEEGFLSECQLPPAMLIRLGLHSREDRGTASWQSQTRYRPARGRRRPRTQRLELSDPKDALESFGADDLP